MDTILKKGLIKKCYDERLQQNATENKFIKKVDKFINKSGKTLS
jgi:hypothetical protein